MQDIWSRGRVPLLVGGTMLYFHALSDGIAELPARDHAVRAAIETQAAREGWPALHRELAKVDPLAASRIGSDDSQRIQRALEVFRLTGVPISHLQQTRVSVIADVKVLEFALAPVDRTILRAKIADRFQVMLQAGLLEEVRNLYERFRFERGTSVDAGGRISAVMATFRGDCILERGDRASGCGDASTGQTPADLAAQTPGGTVARFRAS